MKVKMFREDITELNPHNEKELSSTNLVLFRGTESSCSQLGNGKQLEFVKVGMEPVTKVTKEAEILFSRQGKPMTGSKHGNYKMRSK